MNPGVILGAAGLLGLLLMPKKAEAVTSPFPFGPVMPPDDPTPAPLPTPPPRPPKIPAIQYEPNGRHLTAEEKTILSPFIPKVDLDEAIIWWDAPESSFKSEDPTKHVEALTTQRGIYMRGPNRALTSTFDFSTMGHELVHVGQYRKGELPGPDTPEIEIPAYQVGFGIQKYLEQLEEKMGRRA